MKKFLVNVLLVVILAVGFSSSVFATEAEAAKKNYTTETSKDKIYFPWNGDMQKTVSIPLDYDIGQYYGKTYYDTARILEQEIKDAKFKLTYDKNIVKVVTSKVSQNVHLSIKPIAVGTTNVKLEVTAPGFNTYTRTIKVTVTKKNTDTSETFDKGDNIYRKEFENTTNDKLVEYNKLYIYMLNCERNKVKLSNFYDNEEEKKVVMGNMDILTDGKYSKKFTGKVKQNNLAQAVSDKRFEQLKKLDKLDDHEGFYELMDEYYYDETYDLIDISETLCNTNSYGRFVYPSYIVKAYKNSPRHWGELTWYDRNAVGSVCFKTKKGSIINITNTATDYQTDEKIDKIYLLLIGEEAFSLDGEEYSSYKEYSEKYLEKWLGYEEELVEE